MLDYYKTESLPKVPDNIQAERNKARRNILYCSHVTKKQ